MTLDLFLKSMSRDCYMTLILRRPLCGDPARLEVAVSDVHLKDSPSANRFAWWTTPITTASFFRVSEIYREVFGESLEQALARQLDSGKFER